MALNRWDPWGTRGYGYGAGHLGLTPFTGGLGMGGGLLDTFFNDEDFTPRIRDHAGQLQIKDNGDFEYKVDVGGFRPEEINVNMEGDDILIAAAHDERRPGEQVHREFSRRVRIPEGIQKDTIRCDLDGRGRLHVLGHTTSQAAIGQRKQIPIGYRRGDQAQGTSSAAQGIIGNQQQGAEQGAAGGQGRNGGKVGEGRCTSEGRQAGNR